MPLDAPTYTYKFLKSHTVGIVGCPFSGGQPRAGVDTGPLELIESGLVQDIEVRLPPPGLAPNKR